MWVQVSSHGIFALCSLQSSSCRRVFHDGVKSEGMFGSIRVLSAQVKGNTSHLSPAWRLTRSTAQKSKATHYVQALHYETTIKLHHITSFTFDLSWWSHSFNHSLNSTSGVSSLFVDFFLGLTFQTWCKAIISRLSNPVIFGILKGIMSLKIGLSLYMFIRARCMTCNAQHNKQPSGNNQQDAFNMLLINLVWHQQG